METVIGLFQSEENVEESIHKLEETGLIEDSISVITREDAARNLFSEDQNRILTTYVGLSALVGILAFNLYGLMLGAYACSIFHEMLVVFWVCDVIGFTILGALLGAVAGLFIGLGQVDSRTELYTQGVLRGGKMLAVKVSDELVSKVTSILQQENAEGVKIL